MNNTEARVLHIVLYNGKAVRGFLSAEKAAELAERIDLPLGRQELVVGQAVDVHISSHAKRAVIVRFDGPRFMIVRVRLAKGEVEKRVPIEF
jgi:hypothetical protein